MKENENRKRNTEDAAIPADFPYRDVLLAGKPRHNDVFLFRHPPMDPVKRAKIFHSYDALKGFGELIARTEKEQAG